MLIAVERMITALGFVVQDAPIGTNVGLLRILWVMVSGAFLESRGAIHSALASNQFSDEEIRRSWSGLRYGSWSIADLLSDWQVKVAADNQWRVRKYEGYRVKSVDITGFWRPHLQGKVNRLYNALAQRALPAIIFGVIVTSGEIQQQRIPLLRGLVRCKAETPESEFRVKLLETVVETIQSDEITVVDAAFSIAELVAAKVQRFVVREANNCTARRNQLPKYKGKGARPRYGTLVRPLLRTHCSKTITATAADESGSFEYQGRTIRYESWHHLVTTKSKVQKDNRTFSIHVFYDPDYKKPLVLATDMQLKPETCYLVYKERWPRPAGTRHPPLAAKQMIGLHRQFVSADESCFRLPELALLAGNILSHVAASLPPMPSGFWDRTPKATPGRLRRVLAQAIFPNLAGLDPELRKKNSVSHHLPKGVAAHRRTKVAA